jgi:hypothetical protein
VEQRRAPELVLLLLEQRQVPELVQVRALAWERSSAAVSDTLAGLSVVTGPAVEDIDEGGLPEFQFSPALPPPPLTPVSIATPRRAPPVPADEDDTAF